MPMHDHVEVQQQKKKEVLYLVKKKKQKGRKKIKEQRNIMDINCEVLLQEQKSTFHLLQCYRVLLHFYYE